MISAFCERCIATQLLGGLGNQMFQVAAAFALSKRLGAQLHLDLARYRADGSRGYALDAFDIKAVLHLDGDSTILQRIHKLARRLSGDKHRPLWWKGPLYNEPHFHYDPGFEQLSDTVMLRGYFQSHRYFESYADEIAALFAPHKLASAHGLALAQTLQGEESVAVHFRRGDYASDPAARAVHGVLGLGYYDAAVAHVRALVPNARVFVFSDHAIYADEVALRWPGAQALRGATAGDDLFLMSCARHHIIANSSFSWWSAWLDRRSGGIRIAPKQWFSDQTAHDTRDLCPNDWLRL
jgi:Glycosyl transferase family 11